MGWMWAEIWAGTDFRLPKRANFPQNSSVSPNGVMGFRLRLSIHLSGYRLAEISEYSELSE